MLPGWLYREFDDRLRLYRHLWSQIYHANAIVLCYQLCHRVRYETSDEKSKLTSSIYVRRQMYITEVSYSENISKTYPEIYHQMGSHLHFSYNILLKLATRKHTTEMGRHLPFYYNILPKLPIRKRVIIILKLPTLKTYKKHIVKWVAFFIFLI